MADSLVGLPVEATFPAVEAEVEASELISDKLIQGLRAGREEAYETLISRYEQPVYSLVCRLVNDPSDACDVVQEVFLKVFRNIGNFRGSSSLKTWIYRIAVNEAYNHRRWFSRHRRQEAPLEAEEAGDRGYADTLPDRGRGPFETTLNEERRQLIESSLAELNPIFRTAVILRDIEDLSYEEIAEVMQVSLGTVKSRILRGREALREILGGRLSGSARLKLATQAADGVSNL